MWIRRSTSEAFPARATGHHGTSSARREAVRHVVEHLDATQRSGTPRRSRRKRPFDVTVLVRLPGPYCLLVDLVCRRVRSFPATVSESRFCYRVRGDRLAAAVVQDPFARRPVSVCVLGTGRSCQLDVPAALGPGTMCLSFCSTFVDAGSALPRKLVTSVTGGKQMLVPAVKRAESPHG